MYSIAVFGVDYNSAEVDVRERLAFSKDEIPGILRKLKNSGAVREVILLSTCNRTEVYCVVKDIDVVINIIGEVKNVCPRTVIKKCSYVYSGTDCVKHLFRVVSGLESMVIGETEIVAQVKDAYALSKEHKTVSRDLSGLFQMALAVEKDVRTATGINNSGISMGNVILNLVAANFSDLDKQNILFLGSGAMMQGIAPYFKNLQCLNKTVVSRTLFNADSLAKKINGNSVALDKLPQIVNDYSVVIVCCYSDYSLLNIELLKETINSKRKILIIDLSVPMLTDLHLREYNNIVIHTIDDIAKVVDIGIEKRKTLALSAESIINEKLIEYQKWERKKEMSPVIRALRDNAEKLRLEVLSGARQQILNGGEIGIVLDELSVKLTNKLIHAPTVNLCAALDDIEQDDLTNLLCSLYDLELKVE